MGLSELAEGLEVTTQQDARGVATVDATDADLTERLSSVAEELPCTSREAATIVERYTRGGSVADAGAAAGVAPMTAAKTLHLLGESVSPLGPTGREIVQDWIAGTISRTDALELTRLGEAAFALATYVETHPPIDEASAAIEGTLATDHLSDDDPLADALGETSESR